jgi:hypothetical protein
MLLATSYENYLDKSDFNLGECWQKFNLKNFLKYS